MTQPTKGEFTKLNDFVQALAVTSAETRREIEYLRVAVADLRKDLEKERDQSTALRIQVGVLQAGFDDFKHRWDESERRHWTVYGVMLAACLTFVANLVLLFLKR